MQVSTSKVASLKEALSVANDTYVTMGKDTSALAVFRFAMKDTDYFTNTHELYLKDTKVLSCILVTWDNIVLFDLIDNSLYISVKI